MIKLCDMTQPPEVYEAVDRVLKSGRYVKGPLVEEFEEKWAERCDKKYAIGVSSGATALELAIQAYKPLKIETTGAWTFKAVWNAIDRNWGGHKFDWNAPHIYAHHLHESDLSYIPIIEDCSHVHGYKPIAKTAIFSLFPTKILGACGDAGIIVTDDENIYVKCRDLRSHGENGTNGRMDEIQAAILLAKLPYLDSWIRRRKEIVDMYDAGLNRKTVGDFHYAYCIPGSEEKKQKLLEAEIESAFYYTWEYMALPLHPYLTKEEVDKVIEVVKSL